MKAQLNFDLDDADDRMAHLRCVKATDMALAIFEITYNLKKHCEYGIEGKTITDPGEVLDYIFERIHAEFDERQIDIDELID